MLVLAKMKYGELAIKVISIESLRILYSHQIFKINKKKPKLVLNAK